MDILFIGHSLIEFFDWQERFPAHRVANLGVAGETVDGLLSRIENIITTYPSADLVFLMSGLNDVAMEDMDFLDSYRTILKKLSDAYPGAQIFVNNLLPTNVEFISNKTIQSVNNSLKELAKATGAEFLDIYSHFIEKEGGPAKDYLLDDGVHLSNQGYAVWADVLEEIIKEKPE